MVLENTSFIKVQHKLLEIATIFSQHIILIDLKTIPAIFDTICIDQMESYLTKQRKNNKVF